MTSYVMSFYVYLAFSRHINYVEHVKMRSCDVEEVK